MKAVMKSVSPRICEKVANGDCTVLVSKTAPKCGVPFKGYIYATKGTQGNSLLISKDGRHAIIGDYRNAFNCDVDGNVDWNIGNEHVIGEFVCDKIIEWQYNHDHKYYVDYPNDCTSYFPYLKCHSEATDLKCSELEKLGKGKPLYGWRISDLKIYDEPKQVSDFFKPCPDPYHYYRACKYGIITIPPDEEEYALYHGGQYDYWEEHCGNILRNPPKGWQYVSEDNEE